MSKVVSAVQYHDYVLIFMENGDIYQMSFINDLKIKFEYRLIDTFRPKG